MKYLMKSGVLYNDESGSPLLIIKGDMLGPNKKIYLNNGKLVLISNIRIADPFGASNGEYANVEYRLTTDNGTVIAKGFPKYADEMTISWPFHRISRINRVKIVMNQCEYDLYMHNNQSYSLLSISNQELVKIMHNGIEGGWRIHDTKGFPSEIIVGLYIFCRYIERENEFIIS